jgi:hypothetical protein
MLLEPSHLILLRLSQTQNGNTCETKPESITFYYITGNDSCIKEVQARKFMHVPAENSSIDQHRVVRCCVFAGAPAKPSSKCFIIQGIT